MWVSKRIYVVGAAGSLAMSSAAPSCCVNLSISGAALVSVIGQLTASGGDKEGLLFGVVRRARPELRDESAAGLATDTGRSVGDTAISVEIQSYVQCDGQPWSVAEPATATLIEAVGSSQVLLGWAVARKNVPMRASLRDHAVLASLATFRAERARRSGREAALTRAEAEVGVFLGLFGASIDQNHSPAGSVHTFDSRFFHGVDGGNSGVLASFSLAPINLKVRNIGRTNTNEYDELNLSPSFGLVGQSPTCTPLWASIATPEELPSKNRGADGVVMPQTVRDIETLANGSIDALQGLANEVVEMEDRVSELRASIARRSDRKQRHDATDAWQPSLPAPTIDSTIPLPSVDLVNFFDAR